MDPVLPHDLERKVFRLAAVLDFSSIPTLMRVAWRVNAWVEPLLYRTLYVAELTGDLMPHEAEFYRDLARRPDFFRNAVHHLYLHQPSFRPSDPFGHLILATCTQLETLVLHKMSGSSVATLLPRVQKLESLTHLHADVADLLSKLPRHERSAAFGAFLRLTHLELRDRNPSEDVCGELARLPRLTHLALKYDVRARGTASVCTRVLQTCAALRVLAALSEKRGVFISPSVVPERYRAVDTPRMLDNDDPRFVRVAVIRKGDTAKEWLSEVRSGRLPGFWECAEETVERRKTAQASKSQEVA